MVSKCFVFVLVVWGKKFVELFLCSVCGGVGCLCFILCGLFEIVLGVIFGVW